MLLISTCAVHPKLADDEAKARRKAWAIIQQEKDFVRLDNDTRTAVQETLAERFRQERKRIKTEWRVTDNGTTLVNRTTLEEVDKVTFFNDYRQRLIGIGREYLASIAPEVEGEELDKEDEERGEVDPPGPPPPPPPPPNRTETEKDSDGDGVPDHRDQQPYRPLREGEMVDENGVVIVTVQDTDGDGISDAEDECPAEPGPRNNRGCPNDKPMTSGGGGKVVTSPTGKYSIDYATASELAAAVDRMASRRDDREALRFAEEMAQIYLDKFPAGAERDRVAALLQDIQRRLANNRPTTVPPLPGPDASAGDTLDSTIDIYPLDCMQDKFEQGVLAFDTIPDRMILDQPYSVIIKIDHAQNRDELVRDIEERAAVPVNIDSIDFTNKVVIGSVQVEPIEIGRYMMAEIKVVGDPTAIDVQSRYEVEFQEIDCFKPAVWEFTLIPRKRGEHQLNFNLYTSVDGVEKRPYDKAGITKVINVDVVLPFWRKYLWVFIAVALVLLGGLAWLFFRRREKKEDILAAAFTRADFDRYENWLERNEVEKALEDITDKVPATGYPIRQEAQLCLGNFRQLRKDYSLNIISYDDYTQKSAAAAMAAISIVSELRRRYEEEEAEQA